MQASPLYVVGLGPGSPELLPPRALCALKSSRVIVGYTRYLELVPAGLLAGKTVLGTGMTDEIGRCQAAIDAATGKDGQPPLPTCVVCSGDPGVYALAGLIYELADQRGLLPDRLDISVVPGIPALCAAAALLGAPLMHDFAAISLSDLLTPWELIEKRIRHALAGDFVLAVYNPRSKKRDWQLPRLLELAVRERGPECPYGLVKNAYRAGEVVSVGRLANLRPSEVDMLSLLIVGNSQSGILKDASGGDSWLDGARMVTPRGYLAKYGG